MNQKRTIAVITTSRADYSHLYWPLRELAAHPDVDLKLIVMGSHLSPEFGLSAQEIQKDGIAIAASVETLLSSDTDIGMAKSIGIGVLSLADLLGRMRPNILLLIADRYEILAPASVALALRIPIAHIEGGEISEGAIDDAVRNAVTKMSHVHFTSTEKARQRIISMGEEPWRVHRAGAPSLDHLRRSKLRTRNELEMQLQLDLSKPSMIVAYHPVTIAHDTTYEATALFAALSERSEQILFCYPNADAGSRSLIEQTRRFLEARANGRICQPECGALLEFAGKCGPHGRQFKQRHHGNCFARITDSECWPPAIWQRARRERARCQSRQAVHSGENRGSQMQPL